MLLQSTNLYKKLQKQYSRRINLDLSRINKALSILGYPQFSLKNPINILGSDGKMSVLTALKYFIEASKKNVTAFTSPHLSDLRERFWLKDKYISTKQIKKFIKKVEKTNQKLSLFELLTCVYILAAKAKKNVHFNLVESGLLFRKDSTNLWHSPLAQIVTNINYQHEEWVNPKTIYQICKQKVGYLSNNSNIYIAPQEKKILKIIKSILKKNKSKKIYATSWKIIFRNKKIFYQDKYVLIPINSSQIFSKGLISNLGLAIKISLDLGITKETIVKTIPKIKFNGRVQYIKTGKWTNILHANEKLLVDGCHSEKSGKNLYNYLKKLNIPIYGIWGMQKNKSPKKFIRTFKNIFKKIITVKTPDESSAFNSKKLEIIAQSCGYDAKTSPSISKAIKQFSSKEKKIIVIFGSFYLVGYFLRKN